MISFIQKCLQILFLTVLILLIIGISETLLTFQRRLKVTRLPNVGTKIFVLMKLAIQISLTPSCNFIIFLK